MKSFMLYTYGFFNLSFLISLKTKSIISLRKSVLLCFVEPLSNFLSLVKRSFGMFSCSIVKSSGHSAILRASSPDSDSSSDDSLSDIPNDRGLETEADDEL
jgi:hypothetical protein